MPDNDIGRADRVLVWLVVLTLLFGGLATTAVVFGANAVLTRPTRSAEMRHAEPDTSGADEHAHEASDEHPTPPTGTMDHDMGAGAEHGAQMAEALRLRLWAAYKADQLGDATRAHEHLQAAAALAQEPEMQAALDGLLAGHAAAGAHDAGGHGSATEIGPTLRDLLGTAPEPAMSLDQVERALDALDPASP